MVHPYYTAQGSKFLNIEDNNFDAVYTNLVDYDLGETGVIVANYRDGMVQSERKALDYRQMSDIDLSVDGDSLFLLNPIYLSVQFNGIRVLDRNDEVSRFVTWDSNISFSKILKTESSRYLISDYKLVRLQADFELDTLFESSSPIVSVFQKEENLIIVNEEDVILYNPSSRDTTLLFAHELYDIKDVKSEGDDFMFLTRSDSNDIVTYNLSSDLKKTIFTVDNYLYSTYIDIKDSKYYYSHLYSEGSLFNGLLVNGTFSIVKDQGSEDMCKDVSINNVELFNPQNTIAWTDTLWDGMIIDYINRTYSYEIEIQNLGDTDIDSLDIYSDNYIWSFGPGDFFFHEKVYNLNSGETRTLSGEINFTDNNYLSALGFYIPGADHQLDCNPDDNTYSVIDILSSTTSPHSIEKNITLYPNPVKETLHIQSDLEYDTFQVYDLTGKTLITGNTNTSIDVSTLQSGIYFIGIGGQTMKFIKN